LWLQATCARRALQSSATPSASRGAGEGLRRGGDEEEEEDDDDDVDVVDSGIPKANDPVDDGVGWLIRTVRCSHKSILMKIPHGIAADGSFL
jgi:hypothetical protein